MKIDSMLRTAPRHVGELAVALEDAGYDAAWSVETIHDPFLPLVAAAERTSTLELGTSIAVAFARNPMNLAQLGWDLQSYSDGRITLGFGTQIKAHVVRRFSMPWSQPAARMREAIRAIHAIWDAWLGNSTLDFHGEFYTHTLMPPATMPPRSDLQGLALPRIFVAGVGPLMTAVAAEVSDGLIFHPFHTPEYLSATTLPAVRAARAAAGRDMGDFQISGPVFVATGGTDEQMAKSVAAVRNQIAFYASTPAYRGVLETHGWADLQPELQALTRQGRWEDMAALVDDDVLNAIAVVRSPGDVAAEVARRYAGKVDRLSFNTFFEQEPEFWPSVVAEIRALSSATGTRL